MYEGTCGEVGPQRLDTLCEAVEDLLVDRKLLGEQRATSYWTLLNRNIHLWVCSHFVTSLENSYLLKCAQVSGLAALGLVALYATMKVKRRQWETVGQMSPPRNPAELTQDVMDLMKARQWQSTDLLFSVCSRLVAPPFRMHRICILHTGLISQLRLNKALIRAHPQPLPVYCYLKHLFVCVCVMSLGIQKGEGWGNFCLHLPSTSSKQMNQAVT